MLCNTTQDISMARSPSSKQQKLRSYFNALILMFYGVAYFTLYDDHTNPEEIRHDE